MSEHKQHRFQLWGWILFIGSAAFFMASSIRAGDPLSLIGGTLFLVACFVFLAPLLVRPAQHNETSTPSSLSPLRKYFQYRPDWFRAVNSRWRVPGAPMMPPVPAHLLQQSQHHSVRSELRFFASTR